MTPRPITVTADAKTKIYGDADPALTHQLTAGNLIGTDVITGALVRAPGTSVGTYAIGQGTVTAGTNYNLTYVGALLTIDPRPITVTADAKTKVYGDADPALTAQVTTGNLVYSDALSGALTRAAGVGVGSYAILQGTLTAGTNYTLTYVGASLVITPRPITLKPVAPDLIWTGSPQTPAYSLGIASGTVGESDPLSVFTGAIYSPMSVTLVGTYNPTLSGAVNANYTVSYATGEFKVLDQSAPTGTITQLLPDPDRRHAAAEGQLHRCHDRQQQHRGVAVPPRQRTVRRVDDRGLADSEQRRTCSELGGPDQHHGRHPGVRPGPGCGRQHWSAGNLRSARRSTTRRRAS